MTDFSAARAAMIEQQLRRRGIRDERVLAAMGRVPREVFVPQLAAEAYDDCALPIDCEQTISQPVIVALMTEALQLSPLSPGGRGAGGEGLPRVLEIGTGSGYQTAIMAELVAAVFSIERHAELSRQAGERLARLGYRNVELLVGDGSLGWPAEAPFHRIMITAGAETYPSPLWDQLAEGGILVGPFGPPTEQGLYQIYKIGGQPHSRLLTRCRFVPLVAGEQ